MNVLVINCGSSSIKYRLFNMGFRKELAGGTLAQISEGQGRLNHRSTDASGKTHTTNRPHTILDHGEGMSLIREVLTDAGLIDDPGDLYGIGHRVVHGGELFRTPTLIDERVIEGIRSLAHLAPLHNPANLIGIEALRSAMPGVPQVAVFDTAFHQTLPQHAFRYAIPQEIYTEHQVRRFGFHGTSHEYVAKEAARAMKRELSSLNLITLHLGNGASIAAISGGRCVDTSMGMTPLEGLVMGTRCGDLDPAVVFFLQRETGMSGDELEAMLNSASGLKGLCGANDMRVVLDMAGAGDRNARLALKMYCYRIKKYIGAYFAVLGEVDALVFTAGIGENAHDIRRIVCTDMQHLGLAVDRKRNRQRIGSATEIQTERSPVKIWVIPTNEELEIAEQTYLAISSRGETD
jgi:acetate kinase